jgi:hypothetical protein
MLDALMLIVRDALARLHGLSGRIDLRRLFGR